MNVAAAIDESGLRSAYPFRSHFARIAGHQMHYVDEGQGEVILLLHGNPTWSFYFRNLIRELASKFRVIAPDYIGCGLSDHPENAHFRASDRVDHLEELLSQLGVASLSLVMHDWGGPIGTSLAGRDPSRIKRLVYLNTTLTETDSLPAVIKRAASPVIGRFLTKTTKNFLNLTTRLGVVRKLTPEIKRGYLLPYQTSTRRTAIWDFVADIPFSSDHPSYSSLLEMAEKIPSLQSKPVLIIWGLRDPCFHKEMLAHVSRHFPAAEVIELPHASHLVLEDGKEVAIPAIREFLSDNYRRDPWIASEGSVNPLVESLLRMAGESGHQWASVVPSFRGSNVRYSNTSFDSLLELVTKYRRGLAELGLRPKDRVLMLVTPGTEFLALSYAVMANGATPVFVDPGVGLENLSRAVSDCEPDIFIGSPRAQLLRYVKKDLFRRVRLNIWASEWSVGRGENLSFLKRFSQSALAPVSTTSPAMIAFTSGGTGTPKGVIFTHSMIREQLKIFREEFGFKKGGIDLPLLPIFSLFTLALGTTSVFPSIPPTKPLALNPSRVSKLINELRVTTSFGSPTLWGKIGEYCLRYGVKYPSLEKVFMAGAPVSEEVLQRTQGLLLPKGEIFTPYGATEALPVTFVSSTEILSRHKAHAITGELGTYVGPPISSIKVRIIEDVSGAIESISDSRELPPLTIGEVIVSGRNVSPAYLNRIDANRHGKISDGEGFWHRMGDMGYLDTDGHLYFCGRKAHVVKAAGRTHYPIPCERIFNIDRRVRRSAIVSLGRASDVGIVIEPLPQYWPTSKPEIQEFRESLESLGSSSPLTRDIRHIFFHPSFPVDGRHNAKIFRDKLSAWASEEMRKGD